MKENRSQQISGKWIGEFTYDIDQGHGPNVFRFKMTLDVSKGIITGVCYDLDDARIVQESEAEINGFVENNTVSFIKKYKSYFELDENQNPIMIPEKAPIEINYTGEFFEEQKCIKGDWEIITQSHQYGYGSFEDVITGKWTMKKD